MAQQIGTIFAGTVRRAGARGRGKVWLETVRLAVDAPLPPGIRQGSPLKVRIVSADAGTERVEATPMGEPP